MTRCLTGGLLKLTQLSMTPVWLSNWENKQKIIRSTSVYMVYISNFSYLIKSYSKVSTVNQLIVHTSTSYILCDRDVESQARRINQLSIWINSHELPRTVMFISGEGVLCQSCNIKGQIWMNIFHNTAIWIESALFFSNSLTDKFPFLAKRPLLAYKSGTFGLVQRYTSHSILVHT